MTGFYERLTRAADDGDGDGGGEDPVLHLSNDIATLKAQLADRNRERASLSRRLKDANSREDGLKAERDALKAREAELTGNLTAAEAAAAKKLSEGIAAREAELTGEFSAKLIRTELKAAATAAGLVDADMLHFIPADAVKLDKDGNMAGLAEAVAALKTAKPFAFSGNGKPVPGNGGRTGQAPPPAAAAATRDEIMSLKGDDYRAREAQVIAEAMRG